ncbi:MAG: 30S ribosomal protein S16 [Chitinophagales bacterium]|nr:30S ribosomal protein S16 [Bacteroidota bacterium]MBP7398274.1 30S ribosomal protein S16 [Chitinophagales bacterium]MBK8488944.1 30S ribosomal protein S16 [Bacteroidota bacterium]MBK8680791.1 30S ribosomal protein S16 [Bacteroidota bacterium]MBP8754842.1 30S ribosomal protein S16 [Chitinophagales bacterium]
MSVRLRLQRHGRTKAPFYHIVAAHNTSPRDGRFIERLGSYNPTKVPAQITLDVDKALMWLLQGAEPSTTVNAILKYKGVLYKKHLLRGLKKGALTQEQVDEKFMDWERGHHGAVSDHVKMIEDRAAKAKSDEKDRIDAKRRDKEEADAKVIADAKAAEDAAAAEAKAAEEAATAEVETPATEASNEEPASDVQEEKSAEENTAEEPVKE